MNTPSVLFGFFPPSDELLARAYDTAGAFHDKAPWQDLTDSDLFGVLDPVSGVTGYCCVLGQAGMQYGMAVYLGSGGLAGYRRMCEGGDPHVALFETECLMLSFEDRANIDRQDRETVSRLGLTLCDRHSWPQFRRYRPGYLPWRPSSDDLGFLVTCMEQALALAGDGSALESIAGSGCGDRFLVREPKDGAWTSVSRPGEPFDPPRPGPFEPDDLTLHAISRKPVRAGQVWEAGLVWLPTTIMETEPPYFPRMAIVADLLTGTIVASEIFARDSDHHDGFCRALITALRTAGKKPQELFLEDPVLADMLEGFCLQAGIRLQFADSLPLVGTVGADLAQFMQGKGQAVSR